jgi:hypothetical protein
MGQSIRWAASALLVMIFLPHHAWSQKAAPSLTARDVVVQSRVISTFLPGTPDQTLFGKLTFLGGLELRVKDAEFGGISGAVIEPDGRSFVAISDRSHWITGRLVLSGEVLSGIEAVRITPMLAPNGTRLRESRYYDTEGLARQGRSLLVSVERNHAILRFDGGAQGSARPVLVPTPPGMAGLDKNGGIEALGAMPPHSPLAGSILALAERAADGKGGDSPGFLIGGKSPGALTVKARDGFEVTDLGFLPGGDMLILERRYSFFAGVAMRIRRIPLASITPGAVLDGDTLIEADMRHEIDNMEAMVIQPVADGRVILTLISDDNFSSFQRTLVLRFALQE